MINGGRAALHKLAGELLASGMKVACHPADMTRPAEIADLVPPEAALGLDILVNNADPACRPDREVSRREWARHRRQLSASFHAVRAALPG